MAALVLLFGASAQAQLTPAGLMLAGGAGVAAAAEEPPPDLAFPAGPWPSYAHQEITVHPEPPLPGQPAELCAGVVNHDPATPHRAHLIFGVSPLGIGLPFETVGEADVEVPPAGAARGCAHWIPGRAGPWSIEVELTQVGSPGADRSQRNLDMLEPLRPGETHSLTLPVGNPLPQPATVSLGIVPHVSEWGIELSRDVLVDLAPGEVAEVDLLVTPRGDLPPDRHPVVDVEAFVEGEIIGGIRKIFRPPVPLHRTSDPFFAESEISVHPYPPRAGEPTEVCVDVFNWTDEPRSVEAYFGRADLGIGMPFGLIGGPVGDVVPPHGRQRLCIVWVPPTADQFCVQVELHIVGDIPYPPQFSQRNLDVVEPLQPGVPHSFEFPVGNFPNELTNPDPAPMSVVLEAEVHRPGWQVVLEPEVIPDLLPGQVEMVTLTVTPPEGALPADAIPVVDVTAKAEVGGEMRLLGGFRKISRPPVPLHPFPDPPYAEREITVHPYPPLAGQPSEICVELRNPTAEAREVVVHFAWASFGIGIPFTPIDGPRRVVLPPHSMVRECIHWVAPVNGQVCLEAAIEIEGFEPQRSRLNIDVVEPLKPNTRDELTFAVGNPSDRPATIELGIVPHQDGWQFDLSPSVLPDVAPMATHSVTLTVVPPEELPRIGEPIVDVEAFIDGQLLGGFRKVFRPPIPLHPFPDPPYAEREISVHPYPPMAGEPTEICVEIRNPTDRPYDVTLRYAWSSFGMGVPFTPINGPRKVHLPPFSIVNECIHWIPPANGQVCLEVSLAMDGYPLQRSQRNIDVIEPLKPGVEDRLSFVVGNPTERPATVTLGVIEHLAGWEVSLSPDVLPNLEPRESYTVELTVRPPDDLPADGQTILDVEAYMGPKLIGGFRKIFRPPVPLHPFPDPPYAEREITIHPYPPRPGEPTEVCVDLRNPTPLPQEVTVRFAWADLGIGLGFKPIGGLRTVVLPPHSIVRECIHWVPPKGGQACIEVVLEMADHEPQRSRLNIDIAEPLRPRQPHSLVFPVGNPADGMETVALGLIPHLADWSVDITPDVLADMAPGEVRSVTLTVVPPDDLPVDGQPIVDVEGYIRGELIGGLRKIFRPPVPVHRPKDPVYAESEIGVDPYPAIPGQPTQLSVEVFNPTDKDKVVSAEFGIAPFGIGLPFSTAHITPNPVQIFVPAHGAARGHVTWRPPSWRGRFCVKVTLQIDGFVVWSQRNIDVGEPLRPDRAHSLVFPVGNPTDQTATVELGLKKQREWAMSLSTKKLESLAPGQVVQVTLTVTPPLGVELGLGRPIADVEGYVNGELIGGFRKLDIPPVPIHKPHEKGYAESEIVIKPYPPKVGVTSRMSTDVRNNSDEEMVIDLEFGWASFGMGLPFSSAGMEPYTRTVTLGPAVVQTVGVDWTPTISGPQCVMIELSDPAGVYAPQHSQRNVDVIERPPCGQPLLSGFTINNQNSYTITAKIGIMTFNVPGDWSVSTAPSGSLDIGPSASEEVKVIVEIPCPTGILAWHAFQDMLGYQEQSGSVPTIDVEGYVDGELVGGIEIQFADLAEERDVFVYLPSVGKP